MFLTNIKTSFVPNRVNLIFSDGNYLPFFVDDLVKLSLRKNQELDPKKIENIKSLSLFYLGKEYALRQIAISPKTEKILFQKLQIYFIKTTQKYKLLSSLPYQSTINQILSELHQKKLLNQPDFIKYFLQKNQSKSAAQIKFLLKQKGIDISSLDLPVNNDSDSIKKMLSKKQITKQKLADFNFKNKLYASLFRKGFQFSDIKTAIDEYLSLK